MNTREAARALYESGKLASDVVRALKRGGHTIKDVAAAVRFFPEMDCALFGESWGEDTIEQHKARAAFLDIQTSR